jgi:signal transduction histidine kinase/ligand-binding sensor domain-containing protein
LCFARLRLAGEIGQPSLGCVRHQKKLQVVVMGKVEVQPPLSVIGVKGIEDQKRTTERACATVGVIVGTRTTIALGILLACCPWARGLDPSLDINQYAHTAWKIREGFSKGRVTSFAQTPDGYLWLGTEFGLLRFDGVRNVPWEPPTGEHLPSSYIRSMVAARDGRLWIGTYKGLASWKDGKLTEYRELVGQTVDVLVEDREGTVWAAGYAGSIGKLCAIKSSNAQCYGDDGRLGLWVASLYEDSRGNLWAGAQTGLWRWKPGPPKLYPMPYPLLGTSSQTLNESDDGALLIVTEGGIRRLVDGNAEAYAPPGNGRQSFKPLRMLRDRNGSLWIGTTDRGLLHVHEGRTDVFDQSDGLSGDYINKFFEDREGNIWVATMNGLDRFRDFAVSTISVKQGLSNAVVWSVLGAKDGSVWLGTPDGLNRLNNGQITIYRKRGPQGGSGGTKQKREVNVREVADGGLPDDGVESLFQDDGGRIWAFTERGAAYFENGRFVPVTTNHAQGENGYPRQQHVTGAMALVAPSNQLHSIAGDSSGNLWISDQHEGLLHLLGGNAVERIPWATLGRKEWAMALFAGPVPGGLWLGFSKGGVAYFKDGKVRESYSGQNGLGEGIVTSLSLDADGTLWAATEGGLSRVKNGRVATLTTQNGLPCDTVFWVMQDDTHSFWLYTACGLVRVAGTEMDAWVSDPKRTIQSTVFDTSDGVRSRALTTGFTPLVAKSANGKLWFLPLDGVSVVDPRHLSFNKVPPPVQIERVTADRKTYWQNLSSDASSSQPSLPPLVRDLEIDYTALSLVAPEKIRFRYKLEGRDSDWQDVGNRRQAFYTNLSPGNYRFHVAASNNSGVWNEAGTFLDFSIAPAYYQMNWFRLSSVAALALLLWIAYKLRVRGIEQHAGQLALINAKLEAQIAERKQAEEALRQAQADLTRASRMSSMGELTASLAHEIKQPIAAVITNASTCLRWLARDEPDLEEVRAAASRMVQDGRRANEIVNRVRLLFQQDALQRELVDPNEIIREMMLLLHSEATKFGVFVRTELAAELPRVMGDRVQLQQVLMNLMMNSIDAMTDVDGTREMTIRSQRSDDGEVLISVSDTGVGLPPAQAEKIFNAFFTTKTHGTGMGLRISRSIVESHGGRLWAADNSPRGARFCFTLPIKADARDSAASGRQTHT